MPFKSKAQQRFMFAAEDRGEVPKGTAKRWAHETPNIKRLPEKKKHKKHAAFMGGFLSEVVKIAKARSEHEPQGGVVDAAIRLSRRLGRKHGDPVSIHKVREIMSNVREPKEPK